MSKDTCEGGALNILRATTTFRGLRIDYGAATCEVKVPRIQEQAYEKCLPPSTQIPETPPRGHPRAATCAGQVQRRRLAHK